MQDVIENKNSIKQDGDENKNYIFEYLITGLILITLITSSWSGWGSTVKTVSVDTNIMKTWDTAKEQFIIDGIYTPEDFEKLLLSVDLSDMQKLEAIYFSCKNNEIKANLKALICRFNSQSRVCNDMLTQITENEKLYITTEQLIHSAASINIDSLLNQFVFEQNFDKFYKEVDSSYFTNYRNDPIDSLSIGIRYIFSKLLTRSEYDAVELEIRSYFRDTDPKITHKTTWKKLLNMVAITNSTSKSKNKSYSKDRAKFWKRILVKFGLSKELTESLTKDGKIPIIK